LTGAEPRRIIAAKEEGSHAAALPGGMAPTQCGNPFPGGSSGAGCPDHLDYVSPVVQLDPNRAKETWPLTETCNVPDQGQTASWSGTVTATRTSAPPGTQFAGHTRQRCSRWDSSCSGRGHLPISFEVRGGLVESLRVQDEGRCNHKLHSQDLVTPGAHKLGRNGAFTLKLSVKRGSFHAVVKGTVTATGAHGTLSATGRYNRRTYLPDRHGEIVCRAKKIPWTAVPSH
jgi:hypothetical protein